MALINLGILRKEQQRWGEARRLFLRALSAGDGDALLDLARLSLERGRAADARRYLRRLLRHRSVAKASVETARAMLARRP